MTVYRQNIKNPKRTNGKLKCKCGSIRLVATVHERDFENEEEYRWVKISCKKCDKVLYYNGA